MTLKELYEKIGGDYDQAMKVLRIEKLLDKHIRKFAQNGVMEELLSAGRSMNPEKLFEASHAAKGVCSNLALKDLAMGATVITEEFRPGNERKLSDAQVKETLTRLESDYKKTVEGIQEYIAQA